MSQTQNTRTRRFAVILVLAATLLAFLSMSPPAAVADFREQLARIDEGLRTNPRHVLPQALNSCMARRAFAIQQYNSGHFARADRSLRSCFSLLKLPEQAPVVAVKAATPEDLSAKATRELDEAMTLTPDIGRGLEIYRECAACHTAEGWGLTSGSVPQIAGQHRNVVIKQLADIRAGNRDTVLMAPYASVESIGGAQSVADVAAYIDTLEISVHGGKGPGQQLEFGERLYRENCTQCHGDAGEGNSKAFVPRIQSQQYNYLVRQFEWIRDGKRRNSNPEMVAQIQSFGDSETHAVLDYVSRLQPPVEMQAPAGWKNPDFVE